MANFTNLFSKRQKAQAGNDDLLTYETIPQDFRTKIIYLLQDALGDATKPFSGGYALTRYKEIYEFLCREYGVFSLTENRISSFQEEVLRFFYESDAYEKVLDIIELTFKVIYDKAQQIKAQQAQTSNDKPMFPGSSANLSDIDIKIQPEEAIEKLNKLFLEHHIGYQFESGQIVRIDSQFIHSAVVKPVFNLLKNQEYSGVNEEFLKAHEHYKEGRNKECLTECLKAFESTMKVICNKRNWTFDKDKDAAQTLITICFKNGLVPNYMQSQFTSLRTSLESGIPTVRNRLGGHGQGTQVVSVPDYISSYLLHLTATTILFLISAEKKLP